MYVKKQHFVLNIPYAVKPGINLSITKSWLKGSITFKLTIYIYSPRFFDIQIITETNVLLKLIGAKANLKF